ncbi:hypothetical protein BH11PSE2_BH11PSE2_19740 [soil metagenome]
MDKQHIVQGVANKIWACEKSIDTAMADVAALMTEAVEARKAMGVSATVDAKASAKIVEALAALSAARLAIVDVHNEAAEIKGRLGIRTKLIGAGEKTAGRLVQTTQDRLAG